MGGGRRAAGGDASPVRGASDPRPGARAINLKWPHSSSTLSVSSIHHTPHTMPKNKLKKKPSHPGSLPSATAVSAARSASNPTPAPPKPTTTSAPIALMSASAIKTAPSTTQQDSTPPGSGSFEKTFGSGASAGSASTTPAGQMPVAPSSPAWAKANKARSVNSSNLFSPHRGASAIAIARGVILGLR